LYYLNADRLNTAYRRSTYWSDVALVIVTGAFVLGALVITQLFTFRRTNRLFNLPLVAATVLVVFAAGWALLGFIQQRSDMVAARDRGYRPLTLLTQTRTLAFQARGDESLSLIARGNGAQFDTDFDGAVSKIGYTSNGQPRRGGTLIAALRTTPRSSLSNVKQAASSLRQYLALNDRIRSSATAGQITTASGLALATGRGTANDAFGRFDASITRAANTRRAQFEHLIGSAHDRLAGLSLGATLLLTVAALLALTGLQLRIREYR
jgi:hypothetical protein